MEQACPCHRRRKQNDRNNPPYGLDCSGFVDWVFNNLLGYMIGHDGGKDSSGDPLIIHCAGSQNTVVLTGLQGFASIGF